VSVAETLQELAHVELEIERVRDAAERVETEASLLLRMIDGERARLLVSSAEEPAA